MLLLTGLLFTSAAVAEHPETAASRAMVEANGWSFEVNDHFRNSITPEMQANLHHWTPPDNWDEMLAANLKIFPVAKDLPSYFSWEGEGQTPVKNQAQCGSCWAFAGIGQIESLVKIYYGIELNLSEQQIISCNPYGSGCDGGWAGAVYYVTSTYGGIQEHCMPYDPAHADQIPCTQSSYLPFAFTDSWHSISNNVTQIKTALLDGPVCTGIDASSAFDDYGSGCYDAPGFGTNHLVVIMGWDDRLCGGNGAWIIKNSWGTDWGMSGYGYVQYGAGSVGVGVTQATYTPPPVTVSITSPLGAVPLEGETSTTITWYTSGPAVSSVDIYFSVDDDCFETLVASNTPNDGEFVWDVPNTATTSGKLLIFPHSGTDDGFGFSDELTILGHKVRYVSDSGSNTPPYESPATAAHSITDAVAACTGVDTINVAMDDYFETVTISSTIMLQGGWNTNFTTRDPTTYVTRMRGTTTALRFFGDVPSGSGVDGMVFHDCIGGNYSEPLSGRHGGAIYCNGAGPRISNCIFENNRAAPDNDFGFGGAILIYGGSPSIIDCQFTNNVATCGGAITVYETVSVTLSGNTFLNNACIDSSSQSYLGAALYISGGSVSSDGDTFTGNGGCGYGGAAAVFDGVFSAVDLHLSANRAFLDGGGLYVDNGNLTLENSLINGNSAAGHGGGIYAQGGAVTIRNLCVVANSSSGIGGGLFLLDPAGTVLENCVIAENVAPTTGAGLFVTSSSAFTVRNNIVVSNVGDGFSCVGGTMTADYNDVWNNSGNDYGSGAPGAHDISVDPLFMDAANGDYGLALHTPCLDAGDPECLDPDGSKSDLGLLGGPVGRTVAPAAVADAEIEDLTEGDFRLTWTANGEPDVAQYVIYRDSFSVFLPAPGKVVATLAHPAASWEDTPPYPCYYLIVAVDADGYVGGYSDRLYSADLSPVTDNSLPQRYGIAAVAPNPFNPLTTIWYDAPRDGQLTVRVYDVRGRLVRDLVDDVVGAGQHNIVWDGRDNNGSATAAGVYFVRLNAQGQTDSHKVMLAK
ncbi:MAG: C1 family peptidase [bacterium]